MMEKLIIYGAGVLTGIISAVSVILVIAREKLQPRPKPYSSTSMDEIHAEPGWYSPKVRDERRY